MIASGVSPMVVVLAVAPGSMETDNDAGVVTRWRVPTDLVPVDRGEIAAVHQPDVADLLDPANRSTWRHPAGFTGPAFTLGDLYVWGFTAALLDGLFDLAGWTQPWDAARVTDIPPRFLHGRRWS